MTWGEDQGTEGNKRDEAGPARRAGVERVTGTGRMRRASCWGDTFPILCVCVCARVFTLQILQIVVNRQLFASLTTCRGYKIHGLEINTKT